MRGINTPGDSIVSSRMLKNVPFSGPGGLRHHLVGQRQQLRGKTWRGREQPFHFVGSLVPPAQGSLRSRGKRAQARFPRNCPRSGLPGPQVVFGIERPPSSAPSPRALRLHDEDPSREIRQAQTESTGNSNTLEIAERFPRESAHRRGGSDQA